jgi:hypothetical protein
MELAIGARLKAAPPRCPVTIKSFEPDEDTCRRAAVLHAERLAELCAVWATLPWYMAAYEPTAETWPTARAISWELHADMIAASLKDLLGKEWQTQPLQRDRQGLPRGEDDCACAEPLQGQRLAEVGQCGVEKGSLILV